MYLNIFLSLIFTFFLTACGDDKKSAPADTTAPTIILNGDVNTIINLNEQYIELGAEVTDDTDPSPLLEISGTVDHTIANNYTITYTATDASGNVSTIHRYVTVTSSTTGELTNIDVLVLYTPGVLENDLINGDFETYANHLFATSNIMFDKSLTFTQLTIKHLSESNISDSVSSAEALTTLTNDEDIKALRDLHKADEVVVFRPYANDGVCGLAYINSYLLPEYAYAHVTIGCPATTLSHEIGHNMGLDHGYMGDDDPAHLNGIEIYSIGHLVQDSFGTIMSYANSYSTIKEPLFSNPYLDCKEGMPCGILPGEERAAYGVKTILETSKAISRFNNE